MSSATSIWLAAGIRRARRTFGGLPRALHRWRAADADYPRNPPVLANSFPKSGTHLLWQLLSGFPGLRDYGSFIASMPSTPHRELPMRRMRRAVQRIAPGEVVRAHLFFSDDVAADLATRSVVHFFIYRDLRDVVISEAHYLAEMNRWHDLHRHFRKRGPEERILFSILGGDASGETRQYPDIGQRFARYASWLSRPDVCAVRFESLVGPERDATIRRLVEHYVCAGAWETPSTDALVAAAVARIAPSRSHTFRSGTAGGWRRVFTDRHREEIKRVAGDLLIQLGYEQDASW